MYEFWAVCLQVCLNCSWSTSTCYCSSVQFLTTQSQVLIFVWKGNFNNFVRKGENVGNQHFLLFPQHFLPFPNGISSFKWLSFWTNIKSCNLVELRVAVSLITIDEFTFCDGNFLARWNRNLLIFYHGFYSELSVCLFSTLYYKTKSWTRPHWKHLQRTK